MARKIQTISIIYLLAWLLCPPLSYGLLFRLLALASCGIWFLCQYLFAKRIRLTAQNTLEKYGQYYFIAAAAYILGEFFLQVLFLEADVVSIVYNNLQVYILLIIGFIGTQYVAEERWDEIKTTMIAIVLFCVVFSVTSIFRGAEYELVTREAGGESKFDEAFLMAAARRGIGGFGFFCFTDKVEMNERRCKYPVRSEYLSLEQKTLP